MGWPWPSGRTRSSEWKGPGFDPSRCWTTGDRCCVCAFCMHTCRGGCLGVFRVSSLATREYGPLSNKSPPGRQYAADFTKNALQRPCAVRLSATRCQNNKEIGVAFVLSACTLVGLGAWEFSGFPPMRHVNTAHYLIKKKSSRKTIRGKHHTKPYNGLELLGCFSTRSQTWIQSPWCSLQNWNLSKKVIW